jgi:hypothetical protein
MDRLSDLKLLAKVTLPDVGDIPCSGLTLIAGPNSSGKSQFLRDIYQRLCGEPRNLVVALDVQVNKPSDYKSFTGYLEAEGYFETFVDENNQPHLRPRMTTGTGQPVQQLRSQEAETFYNSYDPMVLIQRGVQGFLNYFGRWLVTALFLDRRLTMLTTTPSARYGWRSRSAAACLAITRDGATAPWRSSLANGRGTRGAPVGGWASRNRSIGRVCQLCPQLRVYCCIAVSEVTGQGTKSLRDSLLKRGVMRMQSPLLT